MGYHIALLCLGNYARITEVISDQRKVISSFGYKKLIAWQKSDDLANKVYDITELFPKSEMYGLTSQLRRAALSMPVNIVEGYSRVSKNDFHRFLAIALGSLAEVGYFLNFSFRRKFITQADYASTESLKEECGRIIWSLYQSQGRGKK